ncbi:MAG: hypothetical protein ACFFD4_04615 [Candidatus Odinarchaeota archaeon]
MGQQCAITRVLVTTCSLQGTVFIFAYLEQLTYQYKVPTGDQFGSTSYTTSTG